MAKKNNQKLTVENNAKLSVVFWVVLILVVVPVLSRLVTGFFLNIDDDLFFTNNPFIKSISFTNIGQIFTSYYGGNYHPITTLIEAVEFSLFGLNPSAFHAVSLLVHVLNTYLVFLVAGKFSKRFEFKAIVTFLFVLHPMHIEPVAWIADKTDLYYTAFFLGALLNYIRYLQDDQRVRLVYTFLLFLLSLGCKPAAICLPMMLLLLDYHFDRPLQKEMLFKSATILIAAGFALVTFYSLDAENKITNLLMPDYSLVQRLFVVNYTFAYYIFRFVVPTNLSVLHLAPAELPFYYYLTPLFNLIVIWAAFRVKQKVKLVWTGLLFYAIAIGLVLQLLPSGYNIVAERYTYLPYIGLSLAFAAIYFAIENNSLNLPDFFRKNRMALMLVYFGCLTVLSYARVSEWKDLLTINRSIAERNPESSYAQLSAAFQEMSAGNIENARNYVAVAEEVDPDDAEVQFFKGKLYYQLKENEVSLKAFQRAKVLSSQQKELTEYLAILYFENSKMDSAEFYFTQLITRDTTRNSSYYSNRAICRFYLTKYVDAIKDYDAALQIDPNMMNAVGERGLCYVKLNDKEKACKDLSQAVAAGMEDYRKDLEENCR